MQIIDELEPVRRGPYAGAVGYVGWGARTLDTAIAIRTCVIRGGPGLGPGRGRESSPIPIPPAEWRETEAKARAVLLALALAGGGRQRQRGHRSVAKAAMPSSRPAPPLPPPLFSQHAYFRLVSFSGDQSFELPPGRSLVVGRGCRERHRHLRSHHLPAPRRADGAGRRGQVQGPRQLQRHLYQRQPGDRRPAHSPTTRSPSARCTYRSRARPSLRPEPVSPAAERARRRHHRPPAHGERRVAPPASPAATGRSAVGSSGWRPPPPRSGRPRSFHCCSRWLQKLSGELELDRLLRAVVDMTFEVMDVDRVTILLRNEDTGELVPTISRSRLGDTQVQAGPPVDRGQGGGGAGGGGVPQRAGRHPVQGAIDRDPERPERDVLAPHGRRRTRSWASCTWTT